MNFEHVKSFMAIVEKKRLSSGQIALWYALQNAGELNAGEEWFSVTSQELCVMTGLSRRAILICREELRALGLINFKTRTTKATSYKLEDAREALHTMEENAQVRATSESAQADGSTIAESAQVESPTMAESAQVISDKALTIAKITQVTPDQALTIAKSAQAEEVGVPTHCIYNINNNPQEEYETGYENNALSNPRKRADEGGAGKPRKKRAAKTASKKTAPKKRYAEFVSMKETEFAKLTEEFGEPATLRMVEILDSYKGSSGRYYANDYQAILRWVVTAFKEEQFRMSKMGGRPPARGGPVEYKSDGFLESLEDQT